MHQKWITKNRRGGTLQNRGDEKTRFLIRRTLAPQIIVDFENRWYYELEAIY